MVLDCVWATGHLPLKQSNMALFAVPFQPTVAFISGVVSHLGFFRFGEHHLRAMRYILTAVTIFVFSVFAQNHLFQLSFLTAAYNSASLAGWYFAGLYSSLIIFRVFFHPLRNFPGPLGCKISSAWFSSYLGKRDAFRQLQKLHQQHGKFLRIGSNDLSITHPEAVQAIYGSTSKCRKAPWYDLTPATVSLQSTRDKKLHSQRRRVWSTAFGDRNLRDYEQRMAGYRALLVKAVEQSSGRPMDMAKWFNLYSFDVMGDLAFGSSFHMLETSKEHYAVALLNDGLKPLSYMLPPWIFRFVTAIPGATRDWWRFIGYCNMRLDERMKVSLETYRLFQNDQSDTRPEEGRHPRSHELSPSSPRKRDASRSRPVAARGRLTTHRRRRERYDIAHTIRRLQAAGPESAPH